MGLVNPAPLSLPAIKLPRGLERVWRRIHATIGLHAVIECFARSSRAPLLGVPLTSQENVGDRVLRGTPVSFYFPRRPTSAAAKGDSHFPTTIPPYS